MLFLSLPAFYAEARDLPKAKEGKALIIFYRESSFKGGAIRFNLNSDQGVIGTLPSGSMVYRHVDPGQHTFWSQVISQGSVTLDVEAGETYYIQGVVKMGALAGRPRLNVVPESKAKAAIAKLK